MLKKLKSYINYIKDNFGEIIMILLIFGVACGAIIAIIRDDNEALDVLRYWSLINVLINK